MFNLATCARRLSVIPGVFAEIRSVSLDNYAYIVTRARVSWKDSGGREKGWGIIGVLAPKRYCIVQRSIY